MSFLMKSMFRPIEDLETRALVEAVKQLEEVTEAVP